MGCPKWLEIAGRPGFASRGGLRRWDGLALAPKGKKCREKKEESVNEAGSALNHFFRSYKREPLDGVKKRDERWKCRTRGGLHLSPPAHSAGKQFAFHLTASRFFKVAPRMLRRWRRQNMAAGNETRPSDNEAAKPGKEPFVGRNLLVGIALALVFVNIWCLFGLIFLQDN
jgi:hypothetical protein